MSTTYEFLNQLRTQGIHLSVSDNQLKVSAPSGVLTNAIKTELKNRKNELLFFLEKTAELSTDGTTIEKVSRDGDLPLSFAQKQQWVLAQIEPNSAAYNIFRAFRLRGKLDVAVLERCLNEIVRRHEMLRMRFTIVNGQPGQIVMPFRPHTLAVTDLRELNKSERETEAERLRREESTRPFDITGDLLLRTHLVHMDEDKYHFFISMHHIAADGWSENVFDQELFELYRAFLDNAPSPLPELPIQYADYANWQQTSLHTEKIESQLTYWQKKLGGKLPVLELPTDFSRPLQQTHRGAQEIALIPHELVEDLKKLSQQRGMTLFMTLLAMFKLLLYRYTGQEDVIVGSPIVNREKAALEPLIGCFLNTLVLRTDLSDTPTFDQVLKRVHRVCVDAYSNQDIPFDKLLEVLKPERDLSRTPLFQVLFNMLIFDDTENQLLPGISSEFIFNPELESKFDMTLYVENLHNETILTLVYNPDLFTSMRISEMLAQYLQLLEQIVVNPKLPLTAYSLLTDKAKHLLPDPTTPLEVGWKGSIHDLISSQAAYYPNHPAIIDEKDTWTYETLETRSNQLAHYLIDSGIRTGDVIAVYAHRSASLIWALLGIHKAGGAFVILDPAYPTQRLNNYISASQPKGFLYLTAAGPLSAEIENCLLEQKLTSRVHLPELTELTRNDFLSHYSTKIPNIQVEPDDLAYIAFTSGSTNKPKGILGQHRPLSHFFPWHIQTFGFSHKDRFSLLSGLAHDPLLRDIFTPLCVGATLFVPNPDEMLQPGYLAHWLKQQAISVAHMTPAMAQVTAMNGSQDTDISSLRYVFFGGETLSQRVIKQLQVIAPDATFVNFYGATETPQAMAYYTVPSSVATGIGDGSVPEQQPIGQGIADVQLLILNQNDKLAGIGELGQICIRTPYLAQGYLLDENLTKERFPPNPFTNLAHDRIYRTGDLGRYRPDGLVEYEGRNDRQVKVRGFRIELSEIETALIQHPAVASSVVVLQNHNNTPFIIAYMVTSVKNDSQIIDDVRNFLKNHLPHYMIPTTFLIVEAIPLTPNGKIDYRSLPKPDLSNLNTTEKNFIEPQTDLEKQLVVIWERVLNVKPISLNDNFFEIGGHSLLAIQMLSQIRNHCGVELNLNTLFQHSTIAAISKLIDPSTRNERIEQIQNIPRNNTFKSLLQITENNRSNLPSLFFIHGGGGDILFLQEWKKYFSDYSLYGLQARGVDGVTKPHTSLEEMAADYIQEIQTIQPEGPYYLVGYSGGGSVAIEMAQKLKDQGFEVPLVFMIDTYHPSIESRHLNLREHLQEASKSPFGFILNKLEKKKEDFNYIKNMRQIEQLVNNNQRIPLELRNQYLLNNFYSLRQQHETKQYDGRVVLFSASNAWEVYDHVDKYRGWNGTLRSFTVCEIPGDHANMIREPHVQVLLTELIRIFRSTYEKTRLAQTANSQMI